MFLLVVVPQPSGDSGPCVGPVLLDPQFVGILARLHALICECPYGGHPVTAPQHIHFPSWCHSWFAFCFCVLLGNCSSRDWWTGKGFQLQSPGSPASGSPPLRLAHRPCELRLCGSGMAPSVRTLRPRAAAFAGGLSLIRLLEEALLSLLPPRLTQDSSSFLGCDLHPHCSCSRIRRDSPLPLSLYAQLPSHCMCPGAGGWWQRTEIDFQEVLVRKISIRALIRKISKPWLFPSGYLRQVRPGFV